MNINTNAAIISLVALSLLVASCSMLADLAMSSISGGSKGGINTELVVGDKEQVLGTNQDVKANNIGKVVGNSDNSISAPSAKEIKVTNNMFPVWAVFLIGGLTTLIGYLAPRPQAWKRLIKGKQNEH